ncbi:hypothetical protein [Hyphomonas pacifica]|uniref:DUF4136 domain-containing protein n=1 Tax=Hyphomonas pacifica TaxID=1280941 RepID=A0A062U3C8_9PROT|nr:hypothetical protein [Hyphomonas pacifica]KCZ52802.1 hypothetical protein HY2_07665 [Hyphomonas pacifica]RAN33088.1 hypothetical protein HY3_13640 [Hyphomonas pacifica]RAN33711.1 hypothetical protein HY11_03200 [Hyphomonas pacifica]
MSRLSGLVLRALTLCLLLAGCASSPDGTDKAELTPPPGGTVLYLPPVAEITLVTAAGLREPHEDWSEAAAINLADALLDTVGEAWTEYSGAGKTEAQRLTTSPETPQPISPDMAGKLGSPSDLVALIVVKADVESSASRLVQGGLGVLFGGVPGPDGLEHTACLTLYDRATGRPVWTHDVAALDPRDTKAAKRLILRLLAPLQQDTET